MRSIWLFPGVCALAITAPLWAGQPTLQLSGMFTYMADAAQISLCEADARLPVAMEGDYKALETAYLGVRQQPGQAVLVRLQGRMLLRALGEEGRPRRLALVVDRYLGISPRETCGVPPDSPLRNTYWKLLTLGDASVQIAPWQREPHLILALEGGRVSGSGGCNHLMGGYDSEGDRLSFRQMASTMMACIDGMALEQQFLQALDKVARYRISGNHLDMRDAGGGVVARFEAVALR